MTDPDRWRAAASAWRRWAALAGALAAEFGTLTTRLRSSWSGTAVAAASAAFAGFRRRLALFRVLCWRADQALSELAASLARARELLRRAQGRAKSAGLVIDSLGTVHSTRPTAHAPMAEVTADLSAALEIAARADAQATARLTAVSASTGFGAHSDRPDCTAGPVEVKQWWDSLTQQERNWLLATDPATLASARGIPVADRDVANRLLLDDQRVADRRLDELTARLDDDGALRAYLIGVDLGGDGRAVVALGDPDRASHVLTHVPGMTSDLESLGSELTRAGRVAQRAAELAPDQATSAVLWLDYDAPDFLHEAFSDRQAREGAAELRRFQEDLRATHDGEPAHQTVLGHSYGSLVTGLAAAGPLAADDVVLVGSPGTGVDSVDRFTVPADRVWASTSRTDVIQYASVSPKSLLQDLPIAAVLPGTGPMLAFGTPERDLWFGRNPSDPGFGAQVFASQEDAGHLGYWDPGRPALDALAQITVGQKPITRP
ncbi:hypothetical protein FB565_005169 [Actinoplanes lutulentus]|uniref:alpha/beta hydrolase n=1 Tax=Actinoplanes lutulentus TaxID=1287878 RepID=UPI0017EB0420|nr:alpha/beta hydrolase [Actinoplanes lutulentus]MBB2945436.1 hypothetical protein [Actinoplanes lutulentus]